MPSIDLTALRLVKVPDAAPPYDCELHGAGCPALGDAADPESGEPGYPAPWAAPARMQGRAADPALPGTADPAVPGAADGAVPGAGDGAVPGAGEAAAEWPRQLAQVMVEVLAGARPVRQVAPWATDRATAQIRALVPGFASDRRPRIQRVVTSRPAADVVEMTVIVGFGPRTRAVAMRFEHVPARRAAPGLPPRPARWLCTAMEGG